MIAVLMAGGRGSRISTIASDIPKPMIKVNNKPVLEHAIECLKKQGITELIITVSHLNTIIMDYFGDGSKVSPVTNQTFGVHIEYYVETTPLGNAGALLKIKEKLNSDFLLLNADIIFDVDFQRMFAFHKSKGAMVTLFTHPNSHPYDSGLIVAGAEREVTAWLTKEDERPEFYQNRVNAGIHIFNPKVFDMIDGVCDRVGKIDADTDSVFKLDLDRHILKPLAGKRVMFCYDSPEYVKDMGTPERFFQVEMDVKSGQVEARNLLEKQRAIFLDRDGTINKYVGFLHEAETFELLPGVAQAIKEINNKGYLCIVVTNQPVIARGEISVSQLEQIHNKMETLLGLEGAYVDAIYYCPHHPDKGFEGEVKELKILCNCRKPKPGMIINAAKKYNIDLSQSWMIGDSENDILAGKAAGCKTAYIDSLFENNKNGKEIGKHRVSSLLEFVNEYL